MTGGKRQFVRWGIIMLCIALAVYAGWRYVTAWAPSRAEYPVQGIVVTQSNGRPNWAELGATGVDFAYITAVEGARARDNLLLAVQAHSGSSFRFWQPRTQARGLYAQAEQLAELEIGGVA